MSRFDDIQQHAFNQVQDLFGNTAVWNPSDGTTPISGNVLYNSNDIQFAVDDRVFYQDAQYKIEYYEGTFTGLYECIKSGNEEYIIFNGRSLLILGIEKKWDGTTYMIYCKEA